MALKQLFLIVLIVCHAFSNPVDDGSNSIIRSSNIVSNNVYQILGKENENTLFCPVSSNLLLSLVTLGAQGNTAKELRTALHLSSNNEDIKNGYQNLLKKFTDGKLKLATRLFPNTGISLVPEFSTIAQNYFDSDVQVVDYKYPVTAAKTINTFVENKTNNKIHDLISPDAITPETTLILVNAAHFKDNWSSPFLNVFDADFYLCKDNKVTTKMMGRTGTYKYMKSSSLDAKVLQVFFKNQKYSMVFILPNAVDGLKDLETKLAAVSFEEVVKNLTSKRVQVQIPKYKIESSIDLKSVLQKLGVVTMFTQQAELNGIVNGSRVAVSDAIQKTYIDVNEEGVEAAAATGVSFEVLKPAVMIPPSETFIADHPFVFAIMQNNFIIFQGKLSKVKIII